ncbi:MAG: hypothetical protein GXP31_00835 [Kiritimatiellaeota bacterium]|nr:hypothetical protein [Kiritimatiellota bacterium]
MDEFREERVVRVLSKRDRAVRCAVLVAAVAVALGASAVLLPGLLLPYLAVLVAVVWGARALLKRQNREYEYAFTSGELDIDVIYNKEWRRRVHTIDFREDVLLMAPASATEYRAEWEGLGPPTDLGRGTGEGSYVLVIRKDGKRTVLLWDPSAEMVQACRRAAPRTVHP